LHLNNNNVVIVFLRAPERGRVKTRLAQEIGDDRALALYKAFVQTTLLAVEQSGMDHKLCFFPADQRALVENWLGPDHAFMPQKGNDLGQRMGNAMAAVFDQGASKAILVGTDIPDIKDRHLLEAMDLLDHNQVVIGPSFDGGYWLIGFQRDRFCPDLFFQVDWGTDTVFSTTLEHCKAANLSVGLLPTLQDTDCLEDLQAFPKNTLLSGAALKKVCL
jgi:rSAM/selenodomain-associated transferase 1